MRYVYFLMIESNILYIGSSIRPHYRLWDNYSGRSNNPELTNALLSHFISTGNSISVFIKCCADVKRSYSIEANEIEVNSITNNLFNRTNTHVKTNHNSAVVAKSNTKLNRDLEIAILKEIQNIKKQIKHLCEKSQLKSTLK